MKDDIVFKQIMNNICQKSKGSQAYLLVGKNIDALKKNAKLMAKAFICPNNYVDNCNKCNICERIDKNEYGELKIIEPINDIIKKEVIVDLRTNFQKDSIEGRNQVYIINNAELLNQSAANSILKFMEEPDSNTIAILTSNNLDAVINTISSRCQIIKLSEKNGFVSRKKFLEYCELTNDEYEILLNLFMNIEKNYRKTLINIKDSFVVTFATKCEIQKVLKFFLIIYKDILNYMIFEKLEYFENNQNIINFSKTQNKEKTIQKISFVLENLSKTEYNINILLFINNFIIGIGEINDGKRCGN